MVAKSIPLKCEFKNDCLKKQNHMDAFSSNPKKKCLVHGKNGLLKISIDYIPEKFCLRPQYLVFTKLALESPDLLIYFAKKDFRIPIYSFSIFYQSSSEKLEFKNFLDFPDLLIFKHLLRAKF